MVDDLVHHGLVGEERDDLHLSAAVRAEERRIGGHVPNCREFGSCPRGSGVPQSRQNRAVSGFYVWHFGHLVATAEPFYRAWLEIIRERGK